MPARTGRKKVLDSVGITAEQSNGHGFCVEFCPPDSLKLSEHYDQKSYRPLILISEVQEGCGATGQSPVKTEELVERYRPIHSNERTHQPIGYQTPLQAIKELETTNHLLNRH
jgi:hypothetical protein